MLHSKWRHNIKDNDTQHNTTMNQELLLRFTFSYCYAKCRYSKYCYAEFHYGECRYTESHGIFEIFRVEHFQLKQIFFKF